MSMKKIYTFQKENASAVKILLDTDIGPDCDDAGALAVLHALADKGEAEILCSGCCTSSEWGPLCIDVINRYYHKGSIPTGTLKTAGFLDEAQYEKYNKPVYEEFSDLVHKNTVYEDAVNLYRKILSEAADHSIVILGIGPLINLRNLLESHKDAYSSLSGKELISRKTKKLVLMGGCFPAGKEWNFEMDLESASVIADSWPVDITFSGFEIGSKILTGKKLILEGEFNNPVRRAYELYTGGNNRESWDQTAVIAAVYGPSIYWDIKKGYVKVLADGSNTWIEDTNGPHSYLIEREPVENVAAVIDELMLFSVKSNE